MHADQERWHRDDEPGDWACDTDVEQHALGADRLADADHRAERAEQRYPGRRNEVREGRADPVVAAGEIMTYLVRTEDGERGDAVPESIQQDHVHREPHAAHAELRD